MKIRFLGAAGDVTGSAYHVITQDASILVDCGFFQGRREESAKNRRTKQIEDGRLDAVVLTHGHLDHIGRLPLLTRNGYKGPVYATKPTLELATLVLKDTVQLQKQDLKRQNQKRARQKLPPLPPLFEEPDVRKLKSLVTPVKYNQRFTVAPGIEARMVDAGHVIGSSSIELTVAENGRKKVVVFSGDLGPRGAPLLNDPVPFNEADAVIMESTYGDRNHRSLHDTAIEGREIIERAIKNKAKILVPVFAIGRTQLLLYLLGGAFMKKTLPRFPIYIDSPMAIEATSIYRRNNELFDTEALEMVQSGELRRSLASAEPCARPGESRALNNVKGPCLIMAGSGMCNGGRILHHLRHNLPIPDTAVLMVGFQSQGTLGRKLVDGAKSLIMFGEEVPVRASIHTMGGFSAHADQTGLLDWYSVMAPSRPRTIITHGEDRARVAFSGLLEQRFGVKPERPALDDVIEI
ncbi:MAG TPA: MBL fold metallo-hydrolase [Pyrinomonadaceae bacterium]|nr:MBL fold metallo-hydrolase [Pyrinomonadaceae bacterium]